MPKRVKHGYIKETLVLSSAGTSASASADFTFSVDVSTVTFTDRSVNPANYWLWEFDDGSDSSVQNPVHTYASEDIVAAGGLFDVTLTVFSVVGPSITKQVAVAVPGPSGDLVVYDLSIDDVLNLTIDEAIGLKV